MKKIIDKDFFNRDTLEVAEDLLGKHLVRSFGSEQISLVINEVEAYTGKEDKASHASKGRTERTETMFGSPGHFYIYLIYGMYWMLNIVTEEEGSPCAILIRGAGSIDGPGKLTRDLQIDNEFNELEVKKENNLWVEDRGVLESQEYEIIRTPRVGVDYADEWADKPFRFILKNKNGKGRIKE